MKIYIRDVLMNLLFRGDEVSYIRMVKARQYLLDALPKAYESGWRNNQCVFVLSTGRTGTMQLTALLNLSPQILAFHEPTPVLLKAGADAYQEGCETGKWSHFLHGARDEPIAFANNQGKIYVETNNRLTLLAKALAEAYPCSKFIHLHRHPFEVIRSGMRRNWYNGSPVDFSLLRPRKGEPINESWSAFSQIEKIAWSWYRINEESSSFIESMPGSRGFVLRAENLFNADMKNIQSLFDFIGVPMPPARKITKTLSKKLNAQRGGEFPRSDDWTAKEKAAIKKIVEPLATKLGYEL